MQCMLITEGLPLIQHIIESFDASWDKNFPTLLDLCNQMPTVLDSYVNQYLDGMAHIFWDKGEEEPYNRPDLLGALSIIRMGSNESTLIEKMKQEVYHILLDAQNELGDIAELDLGRNSFTVGFGLRGAIEAGIANIGSQLINKGIQGFARDRLVKKYKKRIEELRSNASIKSSFRDILFGLMKNGLMIISQEIYNKDPSGNAEPPDWNKDQPQYLRLTKEEKINYCLSVLSEFPTYIEIYEELMELTDGKDDSLEAFGNCYIGQSLGSETREAIGKKHYEKAKNLPEGSLEETSKKLSAIQDALAILKCDVASNQEVKRLKQLYEEKNVVQQLIKSREMMLEEIQQHLPDNLFECKMLYLVNGWSTYVQESYFIETYYTFTRF